MRSTDSISVLSAAVCLAVYDIDAARHELLSPGVEVSEVFHDAAAGLGSGFHAGTEVRVPVQIPKAVPTPRMPRSAMPTATVGCAGDQGAASEENTRIAKGENDPHPAGRSRVRSRAGSRRNREAGLTGRSGAPRFRLWIAVSTELRGES